MPSPPSPPMETVLVGGHVNPSPPLDDANGTQARNDPERGDPSRHLRPSLAPFIDIRDDFTPGIRRRPTLPVSSQVPTPQGSDDEDDDGPQDSDDEHEENPQGSDDEHEDNPQVSDDKGSDDNHPQGSDDEHERVRLLRRMARRRRAMSSGSSGSSESTDSSLSNDSTVLEDKPFSDKALEVMEKLNALVGLDDVKNHFRELGLYIHNSKVLRVKSADERYHALFQGNPGTGKTTVAKLYAQFLKSMGVLRRDNVEETSGAELASHGPRVIMDIFKGKKSGVLFVDEAYQLVAPHSSVAGKQVLDVILGEMDNNPPRWVVVFAGYKEEFEPFFAHNDGLSSRIPQVLNFEDFDNDQLRSILLSFFKKRFSEHDFKIEGGPDGPFVKAVVRRISQGRARRGFGNARTVRNYFQRTCQRQARRLGELDKPTIEDRLFFTKEDLLGQKPRDVKATSKTWAKLKSLVGLEEVKKSVDIMFTIVDTNYQRELRGKRPHTHSLNRIFVGSPGTGKTTVAKLYGKILAELGFLSKGDVVIKTPADFIGDAVGRSESNTRAILASTLGKVLIIDEAYMLDPGDATTTRDSFKTAVLDSIVAEVQGNPGDDRCVLLLGYEDKMESLFQNGNPGLSGRFMADMPFRFADFSADELGEILKKDLKDRHIDYEPNALKAAIDLLSRYKYNRDFSNAREVKLLVSEAVLRNQERHMTSQNHDDFEARLEPQDFDPWLRPQTTVPTGNMVNCRADLTGRVSDSVIEQLERYLPTSLNRDLNRHVPRTFVLKGPPGTGKKTLANYMGKLFRDIGLLPTHQVVFCPAINFIGQHVGQTTPQTRMHLEKGFGKVLIIHDIHRLAKGGYSSEALDELTSFVRTFSGRMAIVLTGPSEPVDELLAERHELGAMFPDRIAFQDLSPRDCLNLLDRLIHALEPSAQTPFFTSQAAEERFQKAMSILTMFEGWGNASLVTLLKTRMIQKGDTEMLLASTRDPGGKYHWKLTEGMAMSCIKALFHEIRDTGAAVRKIVSEPAGNTGETQEAPEPQSGTDVTQPTQATMEATSAPKRVVQAVHQVESVVKDNSKPKGDQRPGEKESKLRDKKAAKAATSTSEASKLTEEQIKQRDSNQKDSEREKQDVQEAIRRMGKCVQGYDWDRIPGGYRCQGGTHEVTDAELADAMR